MRTGLTGLFDGSTGLNRTYHRDKRGRFASAGGAFADRFSGARTEDDAQAAVPVAFEYPSGANGYHTTRGLDDYDGTLITRAVDHYTGIGHTTVNAGLHGRRELSVQDLETVDGLAMALRRSHLTSDVIVHRGIRAPSTHLGEAWDSQGDMTGRSWRDRAFTSTSVRSSTAAQFAYRERETPVLARVLVPKGTPALSLGEDEGEVLLPTRTTFTVVADHGNKDGVRQLDLIASYEGE